jgi:hypothetical protein
VVGPFLRVSVIGRLTSFCLATLVKVWARIPSGQNMLLDLSRVTEIEDEGWSAMNSLISGSADSITVAAYVGDISSQVIAGHRIIAPIYATQVEAEKVFCKESLQQSWRVNLTRSDRIGAFRGSWDGLQPNANPRSSINPK